MSITEDCRLRWNTESTVVGSKYAFQLAIKSDSQAQRPSFAPASWGGCFPRTEVDFLLEIGCSETDLLTGNPACFLCSDQNLEPTYAQIATDTSAWIKNSKRNNRLSRKLSKRCNASGFAQRATIKWGKVSRKRAKKASEALATTSVAARSTAGTCLAPSPFFCSSEDIRPTKDSFRTTLLELSPALKRVARNSKAIEFEVRSCISKKERKRLINLRQKNKRMLSIVLDTVDTLPDASMSCGAPL
jgi:hypothetical protein